MKRSAPDRSGGSRPWVAAGLGGSLGAVAALFAAVLFGTPEPASARSRKACRQRGCRFNARLWKCVCKPKAPGAMVRIPAGCFMMGTVGGPRGEVPAHRVCLSSFRIDMYEVTVDQYERCVVAGRCTRPAEHRPRDIDRVSCNFRAPGRGNHPVNCLTFKQAETFCAWRKMRLPTEAEWEYAARGKDGRLFPWGSQQPTCGRAVFYGRGPDACKTNGTRPVGSKPKGASAFGLMDMAGNVSEWIQDCYYPTTYALRKAGCKDPVKPCFGVNDRRVVRGGGWFGSMANLRATRRNAAREVNQHSNLGFRCAWSKHKPVTALRTAAGAGYGGARHRGTR